MTHSQIELVADEVLKAHNCNGPPVDVFGIAAAEGIELASGDYGDDFHGELNITRKSASFSFFTLLSDKRGTLHVSAFPSDMNSDIISSIITASY
jgi:hypothetical protein